MGGCTWADAPEIDRLHLIQISRRLHAIEQAPCNALPSVCSINKDGSNPPVSSVPPIRPFLQANVAPSQPPNEPSIEVVPLVGVQCEQQQQQQQYTGQQHHRENNADGARDVDCVKRGTTDTTPKEKKTKKSKHSV